MLINNFKIYQNGIWTVESADIVWNGRQDRVFYAVPSEFQDAICRTNADAFIVGFIQLAAKYNEDIIVEGRPVSKKLAENIENLLIPAFNQMGCGTKPIHIKAEYHDDSFAERHGATGISLGVDSLYSILSNEAQKVKYVLNIIADLKNEDFDELSSNISFYDIKNTQKNMVAGEFGRSYIPVLTNMDAILCIEYNFGQTHSFIHLAVVMALMNWIDKYYYATGYTDKDFKLDFNYTSHYDVLISQVVDYDAFKMFTSGGEVTRVQKTEYLSNDITAQHYLDVCLKNKDGAINGFTNCSVCGKCRRTMVTLDLLGKLECFDQVFDVKYYRTHKPWYIGEILYAAFVMKDLLAIEIWNEMKKRKYSIPICAWWFMLKRGVLNQTNKVKRLVK